MKKALLTLALVMGLCLPAAAQTEVDGDWTEMSFTAFDRIDGEFAPRLTGGVVNFIGGKGIGAFLGEDNSIGPLTMWRVWQRPFGDFKVSIYSVASSDVSNAGETGLFSNGTIGLEPRIYWTEFGNAEVGLGILSTTFVEGEAAQWTPYVKLVFKP